MDPSCWGSEKSGAASPARSSWVDFVRSFIVSYCAPSTTQRKPPAHSDPHEGFQVPQVAFRPLQCASEAATHVELARETLQMELAQEVVLDHDIEDLDDFAVIPV